MSAFAPWSGHVGVTAVSAAFATSPGHTYCFSASARDAVGNVSAASAPACTAVPVDAATTAHSGWKLTNLAGTYKGHVIVASKLKATASMSVQAKRVLLIATTCSTCGSVKVLLGTTLLKTVSLASRTTKHGVQLPVSTLTSVQTGVLKLVVATTNKPVEIEGIGISRV
jgi:hypothetical protein